MYISVLSLEIQLSEGAVWDSIDRFNPVTLLCLSSIRTWISIIKRPGFFMVWEVFVRFVDIDGIFYFYFLKLSLLLYRYFIFFFRKCTNERFKTWKHTSFVIFCYCYRWYKVSSLLVFHHNVWSHVSEEARHVGVVCKI